MRKNIILYFFIGLLNTIIHWSFFKIIYDLIGVQSYSNLIGFLFAATFSFFMNSKYNFNADFSKVKYISFMIGMGVLNYSVGFFSDSLNALPIFTLLLSSTLSFIIGFAFSKFIIYKS